MEATVRRMLAPPPNPATATATATTTVSVRPAFLPARLPAPAPTLVCPSRCARRAAPAMKSSRPKRRPRPPAKPDAGAAATGGPAPPRVSLENTTLSLREQLKLARASSTPDAPARPVVRTKFRRNKPDDGGRGRAVRAGADVEVPDGKYDQLGEPLLFVDGYNVVGAWPRLRKWRDRGDMENARRLLLDDVTEFAAVREWDCVVVFDANGTDSDEHSEDDDNRVTTVFTGTETADTYIERAVLNGVRAGGRQVWAATSDVAHARVSTAIGAHVMSSRLFVQELKRARRETREMVEDKNAEEEGGSMRGRTLMGSVDKATLKQLYRLRDELPWG